MLLFFVLMGLRVLARAQWTLKSLSWGSRRGAGSSSSSSTSNNNNNSNPNNNASIPLLFVTGAQKTLAWCPPCLVETH